MTRNIPIYVNKILNTNIKKKKTIYKKMLQLGSIRSNKLARDSKGTVPYTQSNTTAAVEKSRGDGWRSRCHLLSLALQLKSSCTILLHTHPIQLIWKNYTHIYLDLIYEKNYGAV